MSSHYNLERITPTQENLTTFFSKFPDHKQRYEFAIQHLNSDKVIADIACGAGYGSWLMSKHCKEVYGIDVAQDALAHAKMHFQEDNINFIHTDEFIMGNKFDIIVSFETIEHMDETAGDLFLQNIRKKLKEDGVLIISTPINKTKYKQNVSEYHIREYDDYEFPEKIKKNGFQILDMYGQGSKFHKNLYGKNNKVSVFSIMQLGIHRLLPQEIRDWLKAKLLGHPNQGLSIEKTSWRNAAVQIAICKLQ